MRKRILVLLSLTALLTMMVASCSVDDPTSPTTTAPTGTGRFAKFGSLGNSLTAGYMDGALMMDGQSNSMPSFIARQIGLDVSISADADFIQPYIARPGIGSTVTAGGFIYGTLFWNGTGIAVLDSTFFTDVTSKLLMAEVPTPYENVGVPGANSTDATAATSSANSTPPGNSYFDMILRNAVGDPPIPFMGNTTQAHQMIARGVLLGTVWTGNNDILGPASSGRPGSIGQVIPSAAQFQANLNGLMGTLRVGLTDVTGFLPELVLLNLQSSLPYFIPRDQFSTLYPPNLWEEADAEYVLFPALQWIQVEANQGHDLPADFTLNPTESNLVFSSIDEYNAVLAAYAAANDVALVDADAVMGDLSDPQKTHFLFLVTPVNQGGAGMTVAEAAATTMFSLDGIHPNNRGYALLANACIDTINARLGTAVPHVDLGAVVWDPTYGQGGGKSAPDGRPQMSESAARVMTGLLQPQP